MRESRISTQEAHSARKYVSLNPESRILNPASSDAGIALLAVINYQPFTARVSDLRLMTGLSEAAFSYLDLHPQQSPVPVWRPDWRSSVEAPYPDAIRLQWERGRELGEEVMPVRAKFMPLGK